MKIVNRFQIEKTMNGQKTKPIGIVIYYKAAKNWIKKVKDSEKDWPTQNLDSLLHKVKKFVSNKFNFSWPTIGMSSSIVHTNWGSKIKEAN